MNVYDFDKTIFRKDSSEAFLLYCLRRAPRMVVQPVLPKLRLIFNYFREGRENASPMKEELFAFLGSFGDPYGMLSYFWEENFSLIKPWYLAKSKPDDIIITASPDFLVRPAAEKLGVSLIATPMDPFSGRILGNNCHDVEKVRRFRLEYPDYAIDEFYSDSLSDSPLAAIASRAFLVKGDLILPWPFERRKHT